MGIEMQPIGTVSTNVQDIPRSWTVSDLEGMLIIDEAYLTGISNIKPGQRIFVIFHFHKSPKFTSQYLRIKPPSRKEKLGVFSTHSPYRPNPIGLSLLEVLRVEGSTIHVKGLDMLDKTPILDIKPEICPDSP